MNGLEKIQKINMMSDGKLAKNGKTNKLILNQAIDNFKIQKKQKIYLLI